MTASILSCLLVAAAGPGIVWEPLYEPGCGGAIVSLAVSPHNAQHIVSGGDMLGTAVSFDGGEHWTPGRGLPSYEMGTPTFHPVRTNEVWMGSCSGPVVSRDGGRTWRSKRAGMPETSQWKYTCIIEKVLIDASNPSRMIAFGGSSRHWASCETMGSIWLSEDAGESWRRAGTITEAGFTTECVKGANIVKAWWSARCVNVIADGAGWFSSSDGGLTWRRRWVSGLPGDVRAITTHPSDPSVVWAVVVPDVAGGAGRKPDQIWKSTDGGATFRPSDAKIEKKNDDDPNVVTHFSDIEVSPIPPHRLYVSDLSWFAAKIWTSDNGGASWRHDRSRKKPPTACFASPGCRISASPTEANVAYAYNSEYVLKTVDGGKTWVDMTAYRPDPSRQANWRGRGWNGWCSRAVTFNPYRQGQSVLQAMDAGRGWVSDDGLKSWHYAMGSVDPWYGGVAAAFSKGRSIYLTTGQSGRNNGVVVSHDGGKTWKSRYGAECGLPERADGGYGGVWVDPDNGRKAFVIRGDRRYETNDGGATWSGSQLTQSGSFVVDPTNPARFYLKNAYGVFETTNWKAFRLLGLEGESEGRVACDSLGRVLVCRGRTGAMSMRGLWRYDPRAGEWTRLHDDPLAGAAAADPVDPKRLVLVTAENPFHDTASGNGVYVSSDDGKTWQSANEGLHMLRFTCVAFDPFDGERLVAGTNGGGFVTARWKRDATASR